MSKKLFFLFISLVFVAAMGTGCKGQRSVRVVIEHPYTWEAFMIKGDTKTEIFGDNETRTYKLGDYKNKITVEAWKTNTQTARLNIKIVEDFEPGFLYLSSSEIKEELSDEEFNKHIQIIHDFGKEDSNND